MELNADSFEIKNYELTPEGFLRTWFVGGIPNKELVYEGGSRKEVINEDALFNEDSIKSAIGKLITYNHPPGAINGGNYREYIRGTVLQEYHKDPKNGALILSGIVHDSDLVNGILKGEVKYVSAGYKAEKKLNEDGVYAQSGREYNHFSFLSSEYAPRAGEESKVLIFGETSKNEQKDSQPKAEPKAETITATVEPEKISTPDSNEHQQDMKEELAQRVELLTTWKDVLDKNNKAIDYSMDSASLKRLVLSCYYPEKTINALNKDLLLDGFWIGFVTDKLQTDADDELSQAALLNSGYVKARKETTTNFDSAVESARDRYIKQITGK